MVRTDADRSHIDHVLIACEAAYAMGKIEHGHPRRVSREFPGATPRRKGTAAKLIARLVKFYPNNTRKTDVERVARLGGPIKKMIIGAYDLGLWHEQLEHEARERMKREGFSSTDFEEHA